MSVIGSITVRIGADDSAFQRGLRNMAVGAKKISANFKSVGQTMSRNITLPLMGLGAAATKMGIDFETSMTKIETLVGKSRDTVQKWGKDITAMAPNVGRAPKELSEALFVVTSAGMDNAQAMDVVRKSARAAAIGLGETKDIARSVTAAMTAYSSTGLTASRATEILTATIREGNVEAASVAPVLGRVIGIASKLGISFEQVGANIATFTRLGVSAEEAVTGLRGIMASLLSPGAAAVQTAKQLGFSFDDLRKIVREKGLAQALDFIITKTEGNDEALNALIPNVRALSAVLGTAGAQGEKYTEVLNNISKSTGIVDEGFTAVSQTTGFKMQQAFAALKTAGVVIGDIIAPSVAFLAEKVKIAANWISDLGDRTKKIIVVIGGIVLVAGPLIAVLGGVAAALPAIAAGIGMLTGPVGMAVAAIGGLAAAGVLLYTKWDEVGEYLRREFPAVLLILREAFLEMREMVTSVLGAVVRATGDAIDNIKSLIKAAGGIIQGDWTTMWTGILEITKTNSEQIRDFTKTWLKDTVGDFKSYSQIIYEGITGGWQSAIADASSWLMGNGLQSFVNDQRKAFLAAVESVFGSSQVKVGSIDFMGSQRQAQVVPTAMQNMLGTASNNLKNYFTGKKYEVTVNVDPDINTSTIQQRVDRLRDYIGRHLDLGDIGQSFKKTFGDILGAAILTGKKEGAATEGPAGTFKITSDMLRQVTAGAEILGMVGQEAFETLKMGTLEWGIFLANAGQAVNAITVSMTEGFANIGATAIASLVTGMEKVKDVVKQLKEAIRSLIAEMVKAIVKAALLKAIGAIFGVSTGGFGTLVMGSLGFGGGRAQGGSVSGGRSYLVGERGPELFIPRASGAIVPNHTLGGTRSNVQVVVLQPQVSTDMMGNFIFAFDRRRELENR